MPAERSPAYKAVSVCADILDRFGAASVSCLPISECRILRPHLLGFDPGCVIIFTVPYYTGESEKRNISRYAVSRDYHLFFSGLFDRIKEEFALRLPDTEICACSDHSPIDEINAASKAGLGCIGDNHLLITEEYGSYIFLGEIFISPPLDPGEAEYSVSRCPGCGRCMKACPCKDGECLSRLTQKKGELTAGEEQTIARSGCLWGCDICQEVCPLNRDIKETDIAFFREERLPVITQERILAMSDGEFSSRAYAWRGKKVILRNLEIARKYGNPPRGKKQQS